MSANSDLQLTSENDNVTYHTSKGEQPMVKVTGYSKEVLLKYLNALDKGESNFLTTGEKQTLDELFNSVSK
jgi:hypothetical protein